MALRTAALGAVFVLAEVPLAAAFDDLPEEGSTDFVIRTLLMGKFGGVLMGIVGLIGLVCLFLGGTKRTDEKGESTLLIGALCLVGTVVLALYRFRVWHDSFGR